MWQWLFFFLGFVLFLSVQGNSRDAHRVTLSLCFLLFSTKMGKSKQKSQRPFHRRFFVRFFFFFCCSFGCFLHHHHQPSTRRCLFTGPAAIVDPAHHLTSCTAPSFFSSFASLTATLFHCNYVIGIPFIVGKWASRRFIQTTTQQVCIQVNSSPLYIHVLTTLFFLNFF